MSPLWVVLALLPALGASERFSCRGRILGGYYADVKSGCRAFHVCVRVAGGGVRDFRFFCPPGTLFQQEAQTCTDWGDDDGLACPADLYDGSFDLYKIGSGFDTKKTPVAQRDDDEFSLQRAETGDRRLNQSPVSAPQSDLRASHSSDFFSGRRDRGREDFSDSPSSPQPSPTTRAPYRRPPPRVPQRPTTFAPTSEPSSPFVQQEQQQKRKLIRKRPVYASSTAVPTEFTASKQYFRSTRPDVEKFSVTSAASTSAPIVVNEESGFVDVIKVSPKVGRYDASIEKQKYTPKPGLTEIYNYNAESTPNYNNAKNQNYNKHNDQYGQNKKNLNDNAKYNTESFENQNYPKQQIPNSNSANTQTNNFNRSPNNNFNNQNQNQNNYNNQNTNIDFYKNNNNQDNYLNHQNFKNENNNFNVENSNPKNQNNNNLNNQNSNINNQNFNAQNTRNINNQNYPTSNENYNNQNNLQNSQADTGRYYKATVRNSFNVAPPPEIVAENEVRKNVEVSPNGVQRTTVNYDSTRFASSTPALKNFNSVSYDDKKVTKQNFVSSTTSNYEKTRSTPAPSLNLNTVAHKTNIGFNARQSIYADLEDDGQYRLPSGEDDGQYRPEIYERESELLSGAHSLNIAASKNQIHDHQKSRRPESQTAAPRPFSAASTTLRPTEFQYSTTPKLQQRPRTENYPQYQTTQNAQTTQQPINFETAVTTRRPEFTATRTTTFEYDNSVFTTKRPVTLANTPSTNNAPRSSSAPPPQQFKQQQVKTSHPQKPHKQAAVFSKPVSPKEDNSYDYAYYDTDSGISEYDQIEEFEKTKKKA